MHTYEVGPQEADQCGKASEQDKEKAALEALINYAIDCAKDTNAFLTGEAVEQAKRQLSKSVLL